MSFLKSLEIAHRELQKASLYLETLESIDVTQDGGLEEFNSVWADYLQHLDRSWNHLEAADTALGRRTREVQKALVDRTGRDELLQYLKIARNHHEHGRHGLVWIFLGGMGFKLSGPANQIKTKIEADGTVSLVGFFRDGVEVPYEPKGEPDTRQRPTLGEVMDRKLRTYPPPRQHLSQPLGQKEIPELASLALHYYWTVFQAVVRESQFSAYKQRVNVKNFSRT